MHRFGCVAAACECFGSVSVTIFLVQLFFCGFLVVVYEGVANDFGWLVGKVLYHVVSPCFQRMDAMYCVTGVWIDDGQFCGCACAWER